MGAFLVRRLGWFCLTLFAVVTISFFLMRAVRGGPFDQDRVIHPAAKQAIESSYHLDWPLWKQYLQYFGPLNLDTHGLWGDGSRVFAGILSFDFGPSFRMRDFTVNDIIAQSFPKSAMLGCFALFFAVLFGLSAGIFSARKRNSSIDQVLMGLASLGLSLPNFIVAGFFILLFSFWIPLLPPAGWGEWKQLILPGITLGLPFAAYIARLVRTGMLEVLGQDYVRAALAKGLPERHLVLRHALRGAALPVVTYLGPAAAGILTGSLVIEKIFAIPGLGTHFINSALNRDYTLAMGVTILYTALVFTLNTLVDISYALLDPRIELE